MDARSLPLEAATKLRNLALAAADAEALANTTMAAIKTAESRLGDAGRRLDASRDGGPSEAAAQRALDETRKQIEHLQEVFQRRQAEYHQAIQVVNQCELWIGKLNPEITRLEMVKGSPPKLSGDRTVSQEVERIRLEIAEVEKELQQTRQRPLPKADLEMMAKRHVAGRAAKGGPRLWCANDRLNVDFQNPMAWNPGSQDDYCNFMAWLNPDLMVEKLLGEIDSQIKTGDNALSGPEREQLLDRLNEKLNQLCRDEEALIEAAAMQDLTIGRRMGAQPAAILNVKIVSARQEVAA